MNRTSPANRTDESVLSIEDFVDQVDAIVTQEAVKVDEVNQMIREPGTEVVYGVGPLHRLRMAVYQPKADRDWRATVTTAAIGQRAGGPIALRTQSAIGAAYFILSELTRVEECGAPPGTGTRAAHRA